MDHIRLTLVLGGPLIGAQLAQMLINVTDTIMLGRLGTAELAAGTLAFQTFFVLLIFGLGIGAAMIPLMAGALGRNDPRGVRRSARMGLWALFTLSLFFQLPLFFTFDILVALGQRPELAELAQSYMRFAQWSLIPAFVIIGLRSIQTAVEQATAVLLTTLFAFVVNLVLNYALIFGNLGAPRLEMPGAGIATVIANLLAALLVIVYVARSKTTRPYELFARIWRSDWQALRAVLYLGIPIGLTIFAEAGLFTAASLMIGWIGTVELAAHGIALQIASITFMVPLALSQASSVRVGNAVGRLSRLDVGRAGYAVLVLAGAFAFVSAITLFLVPKFFIYLFIDPRSADINKVVAAAVPLLWMAAAFQLFDSIQVAAGGALRGLSDTKIPMVIATFSYWGVGMVTAYVIAFYFGLGAVGVWVGLASGLAVASVALTWRFARREQLGLVNFS